MKKIYSTLLLFCMILSLMTPCFADNKITMGDIGIKVKGKNITINVAVNGYVDNIPFSIKCLNEKGELEFIDYVYPSYGAINLTFSPIKAEEGDSLIMKITGVTTATKSFKFSEKNTNQADLSKKHETLLKDVKDKYGIYEDVVGILEFDIEMDVNKDQIRITMKGKNFISSDLIWKNKDADRWNAYLEEISKLIFKTANSDVRISVFDKKKVLVDNKLFDSNGSWGQNIPKMIQTLNSKYSNIEIGSKNYKIRYTRGDVDKDFNTGDVLFLDTVIRGYNFEKIKKEEIQDIQKFLDETYLFIKENCSYDTIFRIYDTNKKYYDSFVYFAEKQIEGESKYKPLDYSNGNFPIYLMDYGGNSAVIPTSAITIDAKDGTYIAKAENSAPVLAAIGKLDAGKPIQVVFAIDPTINSKKFSMVVSSSVLSAIAAKGAMLSINNPIMQINIPSEVLKTSSSITFEVSQSGEFSMVPNVDIISQKYIASLKYSTGESVTGDKITCVFRMDKEFSKIVTDIRKVNIYYPKSVEEGTFTTINSTYNSGLLGLTFAWAGDGEYIGGQETVIYADIDNHWAKDAIEVISAKGMLKGTGDGYFMPDNTITRAEAVTIISRHLGIKSEEMRFNDLLEDWYRPEVNAAKEHNLLPETMTGQLFEPQKAITREELTYICMKAYETVLSQKLKPSTVLFKDASLISSWAYDTMSMAQEKKIINGDKEGNCNPQNSTTRAEATQIIYNLLQAENAF